MDRLIILVLLLAFSSCIEGQSDSKQKYLYTIIDKREVVGSHYNFFTEKQVVETEYFVIAKDRSGNVVTHKCSLKEYYQFEIGKSYKAHYQWR